MLDIVKASAGSGKTHLLTGQYISMLFKESQFPYTNYKTILAVTFTNKATAEMKERILKELYKLSVEPEKSDYYEKLLETPLVQKKEEEERCEFIKAHSGKLLVSILNDYSYFNVSTIDKFFQKVMRSFARELGQYISYNIELDHKEILSMAVDLIMNSVGENEALLQKLLKISKENIEEEKGWDATNDILNLASQLFEENFKLLRNRQGGNWLKDGDIEEVSNYVNGVINTRKKRMKEIGTQGRKIMSDYGLDPTDFKNGSKSPFKYFSKLEKGRIEPLTATFKKLVNLSEWYSNGSKCKERIIAAADAGLMALVEELVWENDEKILEYNTAVEVKKRLTMLGILLDVEKKVQEYCHENNSVILSETTQFLSKIIEGNDTPFIYEKVGGRIDNYLLDEFQDTSVMQWQNFRPLIKEGIDNGSDSLIVGDVKQSIYRWRGSDWSLLNHKIYSDFDNRKIRPDSLEYNWRSSENVINFNNSFFGHINEILAKDPIFHQNSVNQVYQDYFQKIHEKRIPAKGHVYVKFVEIKGASAMRNSDEVREEFLARVKDLIEGGYSQKDIAVLVRKNDEGQEVSNLLISAGYDIMTEDSLLLSTSKAVQRAIAYIKNLIEPSGGIATFLNAENEPLELKEKSLYNICEEIFASMKELSSEELPFVNTFLDKVLEYVSKNGSDVVGFMRWWEERSSKIYITAPEGRDAIRIMTIHKSKGLEFKAVIIPFMEGKFDDLKGYIWVSPEVEPYNKLRILPLSLSKKLMETSFKDSYIQEAIISKIDTCNIYYVAFTRAIEQLVIIANPKSNSMAEELNSLLKNKLNDGVYEIGEWNNPKRGEGIPEDLVYSSRQEQDREFVSIPIGERLKIAFKGREFFSSAQENSSRIKGIVLHEIMSRIVAADDIESVISAMVEQGKVGENERESVARFISEKVNSVANFHWFDSTYKVVAEGTIITPQGESYRPDRIMFGQEKVIIVDYKFSDKRDNRYKRQVSGYMELLSEMGYSNVEGYLWYNDGVEKVEV